MTYKNNNFLHFILIIVILLCVLYLYKTNENESYTNSQGCLTESDYDNLQNKINNLETLYERINNKSNQHDSEHEYNNQLQSFVDTLLSLFQKLTSIPISCVLNDKNQLEILNKIIDLIDKNKDKLRTIKSSLMNKFNNNIHTADILPSKKLLKLNTLNSFSNLFNNISYIFNDNQDYTLDDNNNIIDKNGNTIGKELNITDKKGNLISKANLYKEISPKQQKECGFTCNHNKSYREPKLHEEPGYKHLKYNIDV